MFDKSVMSNIPKNATQKQHFIIDVGAFIIPYLKYNVYTFNRINITPFIRLMESFFYLSEHVKNFSFHFAIDNGTPEKIHSLYPAYKGNRKYSRHRREDKIFSRDILKTNEYVTNRTLIANFFTQLGCGVYAYNEGDYEMGYVLKKMLEQYNIDGTNCYVLSHDKDLMALIGYCNCIRKLHQPRERSIKFWFFSKGDYVSYMESDEHVYSYDEFIIRKALLGDKEDNILAPIMVKESFVKKLFTDYKFQYGYHELDMPKTFEIIKEKLINKKIKKSDINTTREKIEQQLAYEFRRNYLIFDVYNSEELFMPVDKRMMDVVLENVITNKLKRNYNGALDLLKRVSMSHAEIYLKWYNKLSAYHKK